MSNKNHHKPPSETSVSSEIPPMSAFRRFMLIGVAVFCLVVFSATGPMFDVFSNLFNEGPANMATLELPSGPATITSEEYQEALRMMAWECNIIGASRADDEQGVIAYATLSKLADEFEIEITETQLVEFISFQMAISRITNYKDLHNRFGFSQAYQYENLLSTLLRVQQVETLLGTAAIPTQQEVLDYWSEDNKEFHLEYLVWRPEDFVDKSMTLDPEDSELNLFFQESLSFTQKRDLENEEEVAFEALVVSSDALQTAAVQAWVSQEDPTDDQLQGFYDFRRFTLYRRPEVLDGEVINPDLGPVLSREELGDRLERDYLLHLAAQTLIADVGDEDVSTFAASRGIEYLAEASPIGASALDTLPRIGTPELREMFRAEIGAWMDKAFLVGDVAFVLRPTQSNPRAMPDLDEVKESVVDYWREGQRVVLAKEAANNFFASLPQPEIAGDSIVMESEDFGRVSSATGRQLMPLNWVSRKIRPTADPIWGDDALGPWLRSTVGSKLDDYSVNEVIGPLENAVDGAFVIARVLGVRLANVDRMWPSEWDAAKARARQEVMTQFRTDQLSYEGLAKSYGIVKTVQSDV